MRTSLLPLLLIASLPAIAQTTPVPAPQPPVAKKIHVEKPVFGPADKSAILVDDYGWLRDRKNPEVLAYLNAENAYAEAVLIIKSGISYAVALPIVAAGGFLLGFIVGIPATRLRGLYLALMTLAIAVSLPPLLNRFDSLTGGSQGLILPQFNAPPGSGLANDQWLYLLAVAIAGLSLLLCRNITAGGIGRAVIAQKDNSVVAEVLGVRLVTHRSLVFALSSMMISVAGAVYALVIGLLNPDAFSVMLSITVLAGVVVGGTGTVLGSLIAGLFVEYTPVVTGNVSQSLSGVVYGVLLIIVMLVMPDGVVGAGTRAIRRVRSTGRWTQSRRTSATHLSGDLS